MKYFCLIGILISSLAVASKARTLYLTDKKMEPIYVGLGKSTILSFPSRPTKVILGSKGMFAIEYVENDIALAALTSPAHSNLFVYLEGRRFGFDLRTTGEGGDEIILVRDADERKIKVKINP
jgi:hypothetical protein